MAIKQIQLRGISRTPSDRLTNDGGCAESLNVQLDNTELAPSFYPDDVTTKRGLPEDLEADRIFIHKTANYENYIAISKDRVVAITPDIAESKPVTILELQDGDKVNDITSVGNTLILATNSMLRYILYQNDSYEDISGIPSLNPSIYANDVVATSDQSTKTYPWNKGSVTYENTNPLSLGDKFNRYKITDSQTLSRVSELYDTYSTILSHNLEIGCFNQPVFIVYATRLYDGSLINVSSPIMLGGRNKHNSYPLQSFPVLFREESQVVSGSNGRAVNLRLQVFVSNPFVIALKKHIPSDLTKWKDIVKSLDVFVCPVYNIIPDGKTSAKYGEVWPYSQASTDWNYTTLILDPESVENKNKQLSILCGESTYKKIASWTIDDLYAIEDEVEIREDFRSSALIEKEDLFSNVIAYGEVLPKAFSTYNRKLLGSSASLKMTTGLPFLNGQHGAVASSDVTYTLEFHLNSETVPVVYSVGNDGDYLLTPDSANSLYINGQSITTKRLVCQNFSWLSFPDNRCTKVVIYRHDGGVSKTEIQMKLHPFVPNSSFAFIGYNKSIDDLEYISVTQKFYKNESLIEGRSNILFVSKVDNPFVFPLEGRYTFQSKVLGVAVATTALSQGQFGQFPLYVFTEDGIWAMETGADGSFVSQKPLSREVCVNPGSITSLDNAVVFVTAQGVMMLQGSQVTNISPFMNGRHYTVEESAKNIINGQKDFKDFIPVVEDETHFMAFMREAKIAYDYAGRRLIFIKEGEDYQYIYKLDTQTWHKSAYGVKLIAPINSYPECLVMGEGEGEEKKYLKIISFAASQLNEFQLSEDFLSMFGDYYELTMEQLIDVFTAGSYLDITQWTAAHTAQMEEYLETDRVEYEIVPKSYKSTKVLDLSTILDAAESKTPTKGVIATRPLDLGEPDVFKTITDIRVRGQYPKGAVKFILLGSNDGVAFYTINTLRGKAWKLFRIIILADLQPTDRISWIDVQYENRFTNRLR